MTTPDSDADPDEPKVLRSFGNRPNEPFDEIEHDLYVKGVAFEDRTGRRLLVLRVDLAGTFPAQQELLTAECQSRWDVEPEVVVLNPTHTHYASRFHLRPEDLVHFDPNRTTQSSSTCTNIWRTTRASPTGSG